MSDPSGQPLPVAELRRNYAAGELKESDAAADPFEQFGRWFTDARKAEVLEPNAMTLATADADGLPSARIVLLKDFDARGFVFFTNYTSQKATELAANAHAALVFWWGPMERQVRIVGPVTRVSPSESEAYFHSRPRSSQIGAWASHQSQAVETRQPFEDRRVELESRFTGKNVPMPDFWGGYRLAPTSVEFWQGRPSRLHDRLRYTRAGEIWTRTRLQP